MRAGGQPSSVGGVPGIDRRNGRYEGARLHGRPEHREVRKERSVSGEYSFL
jgi:hypothetical protein